MSTPADVKAQAKDTGRHDRLRWSKRAETVSVLLILFLPLHLLVDRL